MDIFEKQQTIEAIKTITACGEGAKAALAVYQYLSR